MNVTSLLKTKPEALAGCLIVFKALAERACETPDTLLSDKTFIYLLNFPLYIGQNSLAWV